MKILLLDLDHTLYPSTLPTLPEIDARIADYIRQHLNLSALAADQKRQELCTLHGTTLHGLILDHGVDPRHYCDYVHAIDEVFMPPPDPELRSWLEKVPHPTYIFTNAPRDWAERCLGTLGMADLLNTHIQDILDLSFLGWKGKPYPSAYKLVESHVRTLHGETAAIHFADDRVENLNTAKQQGWKTLWVKPHNALVTGEFDVTVSHLKQLDPVTLL